MGPGPTCNEQWKSLEACSPIWGASCCLSSVPITACGLFVVLI